MSCHHHLDNPPDGDHVTAYDLAHLRCYLRLLDSLADETACWQEAARIVLGVCPVGDPVRAKATYDNHLRRAQWLANTGYRQLASFERFAGKDARPK